MKAYLIIKKQPYRIAFFNGAANRICKERDRRDGIAQRALRTERFADLYDSFFIISAYRESTQNIASDLFMLIALSAHDFNDG